MVKHVCAFDAHTDENETFHDDDNNPYRKITMNSEALKRKSSKFHESQFESVATSGQLQWQICQTTDGNDNARHFKTWACSDQTVDRRGLCIFITEYSCFIDVLITIFLHFYSCSIARPHIFDFIVFISNIFFLSQHLFYAYSIRVLTDSTSADVVDWCIVVSTRGRTRDFHDDCSVRNTHRCTPRRTRYLTIAEYIIVSVSFACVCICISFTKWFMKKNALFIVVAICCIWNWMKIENCWT